MLSLLVRPKVFTLSNFYCTDHPVNIIPTFRPSLISAILSFLHSTFSKWNRKVGFAFFFCCKPLNHSPGIYVCVMHDKIFCRDVKLFSCTREKRFDRVYQRLESISPNILPTAFLLVDSKSAKKDSSLKQLFALLGSAAINAVCKLIGEIDT